MTFSQSAPQENVFIQTKGWPIFTSPYGEHFFTYTFVRKQKCFPPKSAILAHLFCVCQSRVNCKEGF